MTNFRSAVVIGLLTVGSLLEAANAGRTQQAPPPPPVPYQNTPVQPNGMEVLARGPVHEAFAEPVADQPKPSGIVPKQPPDPIEEAPPDQKPAGENVQWIPGYWSWDEDRNDFIWVSGIWRNDPPGRQWMPGHWNQVAGGWQWSPGFWGVQGQQELEFLPPPPAPVPAVASVPAPDNNSVFIPGTWVYRTTRYQWRPGYWVTYRPGWVWIPAHYVWTPAGYVFVDGYWDFDLSQRGLLFAPVYVPPVYWTRPNWVYRPSYVVQTDFLLGALFVRPGHYHYYFGDYFEPAYRRSGFVAWVDFHRDRSAFDPLFSYYRWQHRQDRRWEHDLRGLYTARYNGVAPRPPRTLVQQNTLIQNITVNRTSSVTNVNAVTALTPLANVNRTVVNLQPVSREQLVVQQQAIQRNREVMRERSRVETQLAAKAPMPTKPAELPSVAKINLPKPVVSASVGAKQQPPPPPPVVIGRPQIRPETGKLPVTQPRPETRPAPPRPEAKPEVKPQPKPEAKPPAGPPKPENPPRPQPKPQGDPKKPPEAKSEQKPQARFEAKPPLPAPRAEARPEPKAPPKPEVRPPVPTARPEVRPDARPQPKPGQKPEPGERKP